MSIGTKIRLLLFVLGVCCITTAISLNKSITQTDLLKHEGKILQNNLWIKERIIYDFISNKQKLEKAKQYHLNETYALDFIKLYRDNRVNILTYENNELKFWSSSKIIPSHVKTIKEGTSVIQLVNGWYEVIKKTEGAYTFLFVLSIQSQYPTENQYFKNEITPTYSPSGLLTIASFTDKESYNIKGYKGDYLFSVKLKPNFTNSYYRNVEIWLWLIGVFTICLFFNSFCSLIARKGHLFTATLIFVLFLLCLRLSDLEFGWFNHRFNVDIFSPKIYAESFFMPSLGDFLLNVLSVTWAILFIYNHRKQYIFPKWMCNSKVFGLLIHLLILILLGSAALLIDDVFFGLINNSKINFEVNNIVNLDWTSWISIAILCLVWFQVYLLACIFFKASQQLKVTNKERLILFLSAFLLFLIYKLSTHFTPFFIVYALFIFILGYNIYKQNGKFSIGLFAALFFSLAFNTAVKYFIYADVKERSIRETLAPKLQSAEDINAVFAICNLEKQLLNDKNITNYFKYMLVNKHLVFKNHIEKSYLDGYLAKFDYKIYEYNTKDSLISGEDLVPLSKFKSSVQKGSIRLSQSNYFYRINDTFGYQDYFGILPIHSNGQTYGTLVLELRSKSYGSNSSFSDLLYNGKIKTDEDYKNYSIAYYNLGKLQNQSGTFTYPTENNFFKGKPDQNVFIDDDENRYTHMVYQPSENKTVVISKEKIKGIDKLATLSFFFLVFVVFSALLYGLIWLVKGLEDNKLGWFTINRSLMINANKILYKTRIQVSIVLAVVATLLVVGWITFYSSQREYRSQQEQFIRNKVRKIAASYEKKIYNIGRIKTDDESVADFNYFADLNDADLELYSTDGNLLITTSPKMFDYGIISNKMGTLAYINLNKKQRSEYVNPSERIGLLTYAAAYAPIRNAQNQTIAYICLPNYSSETDYNSKISLFINTLISVYALVFVAIGVLAVFLANQITGPLTFLQEHISKTKIGQKNEPIVWRRHDEIGVLLKEYNNMIGALDESAQKLARSERESAWREMAKQVAHEIKNPLTPLKLGVQLLEKSWKEKDPNFEQKFERFSKSFIEQIDSLSKIASEFSNFAKMPETKLENISLLPIIDQTREVFKHTQNVNINILNFSDKEIVVLGDKDQLLRMFNNLLKNAIEATEPDKQCEISILLRNDTEQVYLEVKDNGKGIPIEAQEKIFVPNFTTKSSGTGLGLAFVKQAVENAGGNISFQSVIDGGTTFYINFPLV